MRYSPCFGSLVRGRRSPLTKSCRKRHVPAFTSGMSTTQALRPLTSPQRPFSRRRPPLRTTFSPAAARVDHRSLLRSRILRTELQRRSRDNRFRRAVRRARGRGSFCVLSNARTASRARATVAKGPSSSPGSARFPDHVSLPCGETKKSAVPGPAPDARGSFLRPKPRARRCEQKAEPRGYDRRVGSSSHADPPDRWFFEGSIFIAP